ncbi:hypothetical protein LMIY3S_00077 [Labrys miyagiensis]
MKIQSLNQQNNWGLAWRRWAFPLSLCGGVVAVVLAGAYSPSKRQQTPSTDGIAITARQNTFVTDRHSPAVVPANAEIPSPSTMQAPPLPVPRPSILSKAAEAFRRTASTTQAPKRRKGPVQLSDVVQPASCQVPRCQGIASPALPVRPPLPAQTLLAEADSEDSSGAILSSGHAWVQRIVDVSGATVSRGTQTFYKILHGLPFPDGPA